MFPHRTVAANIFANRELIGRWGGVHRRAMRDLAEHWRCDASYITELVDGLEGQGLARREPHPTDRRVKTIVLTEKGAEVRDHIQKVMWRPPAAFSVLTGAEQRQLRDLARKLVGADSLLRRAN